MLDNRNLWIALGAGLIAIYVAALLMLLQGQPGHVLVRLSAIILVAHLLEIPLAFNRLRERKPDPLRVIALTFVFGLVWWVPARRGVFAAA
jgi:hypothetical protein